VDLVHDEHCTTSTLSSIVFEADRRCDLRGLLGASETLWRKRGSFETTVLIAPPNLVEGLLLGHQEGRRGARGEVGWLM